MLSYLGFNKYAGSDMANVASFYVWLKQQKYLKRVLKKSKIQPRYTFDYRKSDK